MGPLESKVKNTRKFAVVVERDEDGCYTANVPSLPGCHTQAKTITEALERIKEAIELYLEVEKPEGKSEFIGVQLIEA